MKNGLLVLGGVLMLMFSMGFAFADNHTNTTNGTNMSDMNVTVNMTDTNMTDNNETNDTNDTNDTNVTVTTGASVNLFIKEWYPKNNHFVFVCDPEGFTPNSFSWFYGDGHKLLNIHNGDTYHIYEAAGTYTVTCQGNGDNVFPQDTMTVTVTELGLPGQEDDQRDARDDTVGDSAEMCSTAATIGVTNSGQDFTFTCDDGTAMTPTVYAWDINGVKLQGNPVTHHFDSTGTFTAHCTATDGISSSHGQTTVTVPGGDSTGSQDETDGDTAETSASVSVEELDGELTITCSAEGFSADVFDFAVTNLATGEVVASMNDVASGSTSVTVDEDGDYAVFCAATSGSTTEDDTTTVNVDVTDEGTGGDVETSADVSVQQTGNQLALTCEAAGFEATSFSFTVTDVASGETLLSVTESGDASATLDLEADAQLAVTCTAAGDGSTETDTTTVNVDVDTGTGDTTVTLEADISATGTADADATGTVTATLDGTSLSLDGSISGLEGDLAAGAPILLVRSGDSTIEFALDVGDVADGSVDFSLETELTEEQIDVLLDGGYRIIVHTTEAEGALQGDLEVQA